VSLAAGLRRLATADGDRMPHFAGVDWDRALAWLHRTTGVELAPGQRDAVRLALTEKVAVLTGGPGCGKSFTVRSIVAQAAAKGARVVLAAPTGRAAKRLTELTGVEAQTVHRLLQLRPGGEPGSTGTSRCRPIWWWSTSPRCSTCCSPTSWCGPSCRGRTC
jgi:exodeoxyribonuclease V alpha subunit